MTEYPFPEIDPEENEIYLNELHDIVTRRYNGEITLEEANDEVARLKVKYER